MLRSKRESSDFESYLYVSFGSTPRISKNRASNKKRYVNFLLHIFIKNLNLNYYFLNKGSLVELLGVQLTKKTPINTSMTKFKIYIYVFFLFHRFIKNNLNLHYYFLTPHRLMCLWVLSSLVEHPNTSNNEA